MLATAGLPVLRRKSQFLTRDFRGVAVQGQAQYIGQTPDFWSRGIEVL